MAELDLLNLKNGKAEKKLKVDSSVFEVPLRVDLLHSYVVMQGRAHRQGTHSTKTRAEVSGTGKKPFRQKGTGHARQGTLIGPHQVGGGIAFGPKPRSYETRLNKKTKKLALCSALSQKLYEGKLAAISDFEVESGKTKDAVSSLKVFNAKSYLLIGDFSEMSLRSFSNIPYVKVLKPSAINVRDLLQYDLVLVKEQALEQIVGTLSDSKKEKAA